MNLPMSLNSRAPCRQKIWRPMIALAALSLLGANLAASDDKPVAESKAVPVAGVSLTVYSSADPAGFDPQQFVAQQRQGHNPTAAWQVPGYGIVKDIRALDIPNGVGEVKLSDVAQFIDPTTVSFTDLASPLGTQVLEQAFRFDLASADKILERYIDKTIAVETLKDGQMVAKLEGRVLAVNQGTVVLQASDGTLRYVGTRDPGLRLPALPDGLLTKPTLVWKLAGAGAGSHLCRTSYQTAGITWRADYNLVLNADSTKADLGAWVTMLNMSGASYRNATLKLVAGDVQKIQPRAYPMPTMAPPRGAPMAAAAAAPGFVEKSFFEYHLYTLPYPTDVLDASTQQIALFPTAHDATVEKVLVYYGLPEARHWGAFGEPRTDRDIRSSANTKLDVYVKFRNEKSNQLGMPLPKGKIRVFQKDDADGGLEFVGEDLIDHTAKDEKVLVKVGQSFDVVGDRTQTDFQIDTGRKTMVDAYQIVVRNHKDVAQKVLVRENLFRWTNWEIAVSTDPFAKIDARTIEFEVTVPPNGEKVVGYRVRYTW